MDSKTGREWKALAKSLLQDAMNMHADGNLDESDSFCLAYILKLARDKADQIEKRAYKRALKTKTK
jgi:hypothetical protein